METVNLSPNASGHSLSLLSATDKIALGRGTSATFPAAHSAVHVRGPIRVAPQRAPGVPRFYFVHQRNQAGFRAARGEIHALFSWWLAPCFGSTVAGGTPRSIGVVVKASCFFANGGRGALTCAASSVPVLRRRPVLWRQVQLHPRSPMVDWPRGRHQLIVRSGSGGPDQIFMHEGAGSDRGDQSTMAALAPSGRHGHPDLGSIGRGGGGKRFIPHRLEHCSFAHARSRDSASATMSCWARPVMADGAAPSPWRLPTRARNQRPDCTVGLMRTPTAAASIAAVRARGLPALRCPVSRAMPPLRHGCCRAEIGADRTRLAKDSPENTRARTVSRAHAEAFRPPSSAPPSAPPLAAAGRSPRIATASSVVICATPRSSPHLR